MTTESKHEVPSVKLIEALRASGIPQRVIASRLAISPSAVSLLLRGDRALKFDEAVKIQNMIGQVVTSDQPAGRELPVIGWSGAGKWLEAIELARRAIWVPNETSGKFGLDVVGDSMNLVLPEGSVAIVDPEQTDLYSGKLYLLQNSEGEATIKRYRSDPARFEPVSDNDEYVPFRVGSTDFKVIGRVTGGLQAF
ncbi:hypothetical protein GR702_05500 [Novosphingobium sp. FGD1]|uniref:Peptidase S24/S26A/S26B/S26C domain-containing protein n=1 Tax=Novosphingobium silvae TaxID=2692619 RepID=A0A7X4GEQ7_9SPHN|nr:S24 family peptidase [Novosphingobium silvae]MYL97226.1 hypothetical protein [Novosphingobium silvae]